MPAKRLPPRDPVKKKARKTGATSEPHGQGDDYYYQNGGDPMPQYRKGRPKKTTEGYEPWQWSGDEIPTVRSSLGANLSAIVTDYVKRNRKR